MKLGATFKEQRSELANRREVLVYHDNARHHTPLTTVRKLLKLRWELLAYPLYRPNLTPSDYPLFQSLQSSLN